ncbi:MAG: 4Fe-4S dicluster domain-containing protein [Planctomycetaceae bacterium]|jgi:ferredoxin|nr:4Fe-4S dicluster domain-containing protein [Planctomycetaceae bacterium]
MSQQTELQEKAKELLADKTADVVIGYGIVETNIAAPVFITDAKETHRLIWNDQCTANLTVYLTRAEVKKLGKAAVVCKGCDARTIAVLIAENQLTPEDTVVIGVECNGVKQNGQMQDKCLSCDVHLPPNCNIIIRNTEQNDTPPQNSAAERYVKVERIMMLPPKERFEYWQKELSRCVKCYACRQNCPLCYCNICVADKNRPVRIDTSSTLKGNLAWNILRAFHLAGRCVGCSSCASACPANIDLDILNLCLTKAAEEKFNYRSGYDPKVLPPIGSFSPDDSENFIR